MQRIQFTTLAAVLAFTLTAAEPKDEVKTAAGKLGAQPNYSWTTTTKLEGSPWTPGPINGKTEKDGFTCVSQEMNNNTAEAFLKGDKAVLKTDEGWKSPQELEQTAGGSPGGGRMMGRMLANVKCPAVEAVSLVDKVKALTPGAGGLFSGELTEEGAKELMTMGRRGRQGQTPPAPKNAKGSVKFWIQDGALTKYEVSVSGVITFGQDQQEREMSRVTTVEVKDTGKTKVEVPEEVKKKLTT